MAINPPEGIADFLAFVSGMDWPEADEDLMRRVAEHYRSIADDLETLSGYVIELIPIVKNDFEGEAAESFLLSMRDLTGQTAGANQLEQTAELSRQLSEVALKVANQVEYTKIMAILQLVQLLAEILFATLFSAFTFGAVWGPVSALFAATREGLHQLFRWLLQTILSQTFIGIMGGVFQDTVIQLYQLTSGHTSSWNTESLLDSVKQGALSGVIAGPLEILSHYGGKLLGRILGGKPPASIISKRVDDVLNKIDDKLDDVTPNPKPDVPPGGAGKPGGPEGVKTKEDLPPSPPNTPPTEVTPPPVPPKRTEGTPPPVPPKDDVAPPVPPKNDVAPPPVPPKSDVAPPVPARTEGGGLVSPPPAGRPKAETPVGAGAKDKPTAPATGSAGAPAAGKGTAPTTGRGDVPAAPPKADVPTTGKGEVPGTGRPDTPHVGKGDVPTTGRGDVPTTGKGDGPTAGKGEVPGADKPEVPTAQRTEGGGDTAGAGAGAGRTGSGDVPTAGTGSDVPGTSGSPGRVAGDAENPLDGLLSTPEARSSFAKDIGELFGGVTRNLETGFLRHGEGSIAHSFAEKMGEVFKKHLAHEGAQEAGEEFGRMLTQKWGRAGADHADLPDVLTRAMGDLGNLAPLKNLADSMPTLFARSEHSNALARVFKQENPLQGSPMSQLGGAVSSLLNEGTNEMLSEGFYNMIFGDGTFEVSGGPFASGVAMGALSAGLHRAFEPVMVKYQNWVLTHQHADNPTDSKYFGLLHPLNIASFVSNMTGNPAPWPVPRPTSEQQETSFRQDMKDMVKWVFSHPVTGTPFFTDLPGRPDAPSDGDAFTPLDLDLGPSFGDEIAKDPLFRTESDGGLAPDGVTGDGPTDGRSDDGPIGGRTDDGPTTEGDTGDRPATAPPRATISSGLSSLLGEATEVPGPGPAERPVTLSGDDRFSTPPHGDTDAPAPAPAPAPARAPVTPEAPSPYDWEHLETPSDDRLMYLPVDDAPRPDGDDTRAEDDSVRTPSDDSVRTPSGDRSGHGNGNAVEGGSTVVDGGGDGDGGHDGDTPSGPPVRDIPSGIALGVLSPAQSTALQAVPKLPGVFVVGMHTDPDAPNDPATVLKALTDAHDEGRLDGVTEIRFTACHLAAPVHEGTVRTVMSGLWKHRAATGTASPDPLTARAADAPVWYVPTTGGDAAGGHLLTARHIGLTPDGKIAVVDRGAWHVYGDSGDAEHTPVRTTPDPDTLPDDAVAFLFRTPKVDAVHPDAVKFGDGDDRSPVDKGKGRAEDDDDPPPTGNGEGPSTRRPRRTRDDQEDPPSWAQDASLDDMDRIYYTEASVQYEKNLAAYLARRRDVQELAGQLSGVLWDKLQHMEGINKRLGTPSNESPGAVGTEPTVLEEVARKGNLRERMAMFFNAISTKALGERIGTFPPPPSSLVEERRFRVDNHEFVEYRDLTRLVPALRTKLSAMPERTDEERRSKKEAREDFEKRDHRWKQLSAELRSFEEADIVPRLSARERPLALNTEEKVRWIPGGARYLLKTELLYLKQTHGHLATAGTSGSGFMFHRYAELMAERGWFRRINHKTLRLAIIAAFLNQGHHSLPEVMAGSAAFAAHYREEHPDRPLPDDIAALRAPLSEPGRDYYRTLDLVPEADLRRHVAHEGKFPDEIAAERMEELRRTYAAREDENSPVEGTSTGMDVDEPGPPPPSSSRRKRGNPDDRDADGDVLMQDPKRPRQGDDDCGDTAAHVPESSPHTLPGRMRPEEVSPVARPVTADRWASWRWAPGRQDVPPPARVRTERFDPAADPDATGPFPGTADRRNEDGTLAGRRTLIRADVERFVVPEDGDGAPGGPVRLVRVTLPVAVGDSFSEADAAALRTRMQGLLDSHVNLGFRLPRTGDQLHTEVDVVPASEGGAGLVRVTRDGGPGTRSDQLNLRLHADDSDPDVRGRDDAMLLHELLHYAGLPDRYHDAEALFRRTPDRADASGVMATSVLPGGTLPHRYLEAVEDATESGSVLHDNEGPGSWTVPSPTPVRDIPAGISVGALSPAQAAALRALPARAGVFVVGTHTDPNAPLDPAVLLKALTDAHDEGRLDGVTEIRFTGCDLASRVHGATVRTVMSGLWKHRAETGADGPLTGLAADAPVWYVPGGDRVFTARHVGVTADGRMTVLGRADWHRFTDTGAPDHTPETTPAGDDGAPVDAVRLADGDETGPEHAEAVRFGEETGPEHAEAVRFGEETGPERAEAVRFGDDTDDEDVIGAGEGNGDTSGDGEDGAVAVSMLVDGLPALKKRTVAFGKGEKTLGPQDETELRNLAAELLPELTRRAADPALGVLRVEVVAAGNSLWPGAAQRTGWKRAQAVSSLLKEEIRLLAHGLGREDVIDKAWAEALPGLASFELRSRGLTGVEGLDLSGDGPRTEQRRRATASAEVTYESAYRPRLSLSVETTAQAVDLFRRMADRPVAERTAVSLDELTGPRIFWKSSSDLPDTHNLVIQVQTAQGGGQRHLTGNMSIFTPGTRVHVASFERTDSGRSLVTLLEAGPDTVWPPGGPERGEPVLGLPGVGYPGPNRPFDSTLKYVKEETKPKDGEGRGRKKAEERNPRTTAGEIPPPGTEPESSARAAARPDPAALPNAAQQTSGHYEFQQAYYIHRGEVDVEMEDGEPYVRFYTAVVSRDTVTAHETPHEFTAEHKDVQQHKDTGEVVVATGNKPGGTLWVGMGTPARAIGWAMKYQAQFPDKKPLIRSFLVPLHVYQRITAASVPEHDAGSLGHPYRGSASLTPGGLRDPEENPESEIESIYRDRWKSQAPGSARAPIPDHKETDRSQNPDEDAETTPDRPLAGRPVNTDQSGERNQFGVRGESLVLLRRSIRPNSLITYYGDKDRGGLAPDEDTDDYRDGATVHVDVLRDRLGIPPVDAPQLNDRYNPWVQNAGHVNSPDVLRGISSQLRQFHETWKQSRQRPADRRVGHLLEPDMPPEPYGNRPNLSFGRRLADLRKFLEDHGEQLRVQPGKPVPLDFLGKPDADLESADLDARAAVETFMRNTVLPWASHAEIGLVLSLQSQEVKADLNVTDSPFLHDFDDMRRRQPEEAHLQRQVGRELTQLWREGTALHRVIDRLIRDYPELGLLYKEICAPSEGYTFFQHAQMVLGQYLKLAHRDRDSADRLVPVDAVVKAILFHDIEKANSKLMYGGDGKSKVRRAELHDHEAEHRGAVEVMNRYRHLWGDVDKDPVAGFAYRAAVLMVDSDPFGFYYRDKHRFLRPKGSDAEARTASAGLNRDVTFHWIVESYMKLRGRDPVTTDGDVRRLAELSTEDTEEIRRLFHEFHQYYQADFSSYTTYSTYVDYKEPRATPEERAMAAENARSTRQRAEENAEREKEGLGPLPKQPAAPSFGLSSRELDAVKHGEKTFTRLFAPVPEEKDLVLNPDNPYGTGPKTAETSPVRGRSSLRFVFADMERHDGASTHRDRDYEGMYGELAKMFESEESFREHYGRVGGERMRQGAKYLGDEKNAKDHSAPPAPKKSKQVTDLLDQDLFIEFGNERSSSLTPVPTSVDAPAPVRTSVDAPATVRTSVDAPATVRTSDERIGELVSALALSHQGNGTRHLVDPDAGEAEADRIRGAVGRFPRDDRFLTLASHITGGDGAPVWRGQRVTPGELAVVLSRLADEGAWDTAKPLRFAACGLGGDLERSYAADTLRELRSLRPDLPLTAYAPRSTLWFVPSATDPDPAGAGHTVVARQVSWGPDGRPRLTPDHWVKLSLPADGDGTVETTLLGAHMPPDGLLSPDDLPVTTPAPEGYRVDDAFFDERSLGDDAQRRSTGPKPTPETDGMDEAEGADEAEGTDETGATEGVGEVEGVTESPETAPSPAPGSFVLSSWT
ncbi:WXG100-like domain-containing protein [Streptomyces sp. NPDC055051]